MAKSMMLPEYQVSRDRERCINCKVCVNQCANGVHVYDEDLKKVINKDEFCVNCHRCAVYCPTRAIKIAKWEQSFKPKSNWNDYEIKNLYLQAATGGVLLSSMGNDKDFPVYWDHLLLNASQVTNPSIDPLREPIELKTYLGRRPDLLDNAGALANPFPPQVELEVPLMFSAMSFGSVSLNTHRSLAAAAKKLGILWNAGEGGVHEDVQSYMDCTIVQVASGRFGVNPDMLSNSAAVEIKIGQGAKPGIGGHLSRALTQTSATVAASATPIARILPSKSLRKPLKLTTTIARVVACVPMSAHVRPLQWRKRGSSYGEKSCH